MQAQPLTPEQKALFVYNIRVVVGLPPFRATVRQGGSNPQREYQPPSVSIAESKPTG